MKQEADRFSIYDVFKNEIVWKVPKDVKGNVFACDSDATWILYPEGTKLCIQSIAIPESLDVYIKPIYFSWEHRWNPGKLAQEKSELMEQTEELLESYLKFKGKRKLVKLRKMLE